MNPAQFNKRIILQKKEIELDDLLQEIETFVEYDPLWAMYKSSRASEVIESGREQMAKEGRFVVRWSKGLQQFINNERATFEILFNDRIYDVESAINDDEANKTITIIVGVRE